MSAIILGDLHIGKSQVLGKSGIGTSLNSRVVDQLNILDWVLDKANDNLINDIIITGDVFEEPKPSVYLVAHFISWLKKCQSNNINVHIVIGNHDILRSGNFYISPLDIISEAEIHNVFIYKQIDTFFIKDCAYTLVPFRDRRSFNCESNSEALNILEHIIQYELATIPITYKKVVVGHLAIEGSIPVGDEIDDMTNELFCTPSMFKGYDYVWMGHVHKQQIMYNKDNYIAHIGSMDISNFGECDQEKKIVIINPDEKDFFKYENIPVRPLKKISVSVPDDLDDPTKYILEQLQPINNLDKSIIKLDIGSNGKQINKLAIEKLLLEKGVFNISSFSETKKASFVKKDQNNSIDNKMDATSAIKKYSDLYIEKTKQNRFISLAMEILSKLPGVD